MTLRKRLSLGSIALCAVICFSARGWIEDGVAELIDPSGAWAAPVNDPLPVERNDPDAIVTDDACRSCCQREFESVELRVEMDRSGFVGHVFLYTPTHTCGFYPLSDDLGVRDYFNPLSLPVGGEIHDDTGHRYDRARRYRVCPESARRLDESIQRHQHDCYQLGNWSGCRNCVTWALDRLRDAGLAVPDGDRPNVIGRVMTPVSECGDLGTSR